MKKTKKIIKLILSDKLYIPRKFFESLESDDKSIILDGFTFKTVNPSSCAINRSSLPCDIKEDEDNDINNCSVCPYAVVTLKSYNKNKKWVKLDRGDLPKIKEVVSFLKSVTEKEITVEDRRVFPKIKKEERYNILWKKLDEREDSQKKMVSDWLDIRYGQIVCPPRSGKTVMCVILLSKIPTRAAIVAHRKELIDQFLTTFYEFTDIREKEKIYGHKLIKINPRPEEVDKLHICLYTWQQFGQKYGLKKLKKVRDKFGIILVDEAHRSSSGVYSQRLSRFKAKYRGGVTATPKRKDSHEFIGNNVIGPPVLSGGEEQLPIKYRFMETGFVLPEYKNMGNREWNWFWNKISYDRERNELIAETAKKDLLRGHKIIIPVKRVKQTLTLKKFIEKEFEGEDWVPNVVSYTDTTIKKKEREIVANDIRAGVYDVVIATSALISEGFDAPAMSCLYEVVPIFSVDNLYQEYSRIRTKSKKKKRKPFVRVFIDDGHISNRFKALVEKEFESRGFKEI